MKKNEKTYTQVVMYLLLLVQRIVQLAEKATALENSIEAAVYPSLRGNRKYYLVPTLSKWEPQYSRDPSR